MASMSSSSETWTFSYDTDGMRTGRTNGTRTYGYIYNGSSLSQMTVDGHTLDFTYDASGRPLALTFNGTPYYYALNLQGDVVAILDGSGNTVVYYVYDAWGYERSCSGSLSGTLGYYNPLRYRGYVYDAEYKLYYLQSRYYDPGLGRFNAPDVYASTGQGILGNNMFAYCRNNPVARRDSVGTADEETIQDTVDRLKKLLEDYSVIDESGFAINIESAATEWDTCIKEMGIQDAYDYMSNYLCGKYASLYGKEYLFSDACVSYEIEYHVDAYMCVMGYTGYSRNITTFFFSKEYLIEHCRIINISTADVNNKKQAIMFGYRDGIRAVYIGTNQDPYYITTIALFGYEIIVR